MNDIKGKITAGVRFNRLVAVAVDPSKPFHWLFACDCGTTTSRKYHNVVSGAAKSCGCHARESSRERLTKHGCTSWRGPKRSEYTTWQNMKKRCQDQKSKHYGNYGGRGIAVCDRWETFDTFLSDMGPKPTPKHTLERVDNDKGYSPDNCIWATRTQQGRNKRNNLLLTFRGETKCLTEWAETLGFHRCTLQERLKLGWSVERTLTEAVAS